MRFVYSTLFAAVCLAATGCGGETRVRLEGTIVKNGVPLQVKDNEEITMSFLATQQDAKVGLASVNFDRSTGRFTVHGAAESGIAPGIYKITISQTPYQQQHDFLKGAYSAAKTPLFYTVTDDAHQDIVVDIGQNKVTKN